MHKSLQDWDGKLHAASGHNLFDGTDCTWQGEVPFLIRGVSRLSPPLFPVMPWLCAAEMLWPVPVKKVCKDFSTSPPRAWHPRSRFTVSWLCLAWVVTGMVALAREMKTLSLWHSAVFRGMPRVFPKGHTQPSKGMLKHREETKEFPSVQGEQASFCLTSWRIFLRELASVMQGSGHWFPSWILHLSTCPFYIL